MKKLLLFLGAFSILEVSAQDQLLNSGFNSWPVTVLAKKPTGWSSSYDQSAPFYISPQPIEKSTDATHLSNSLKLNSYLDPNNSNNPQFAFALLGSIDNQGPTGGFPYSDLVDSIVFDVKCSIQPGDSANVLVVIKSGGVIKEMNFYRYGGYKSSWTRMAYRINLNNDIPDTILVGFTSSEPNNGGINENSWTMIDNVRFKNGTTTTSSVLNNSFENWTDITVENPADWWTFNDMFAGSSFSTTMKSTDMQEGSYALKLKPDTLQMGGSNGNFIPGFAINGSLDLVTHQVSGKPFVASPTSFTGYYKWAPNGTDTASIFLSFRGGGNDLFMTDSLFTVAKSTYTQFSLPITLPSAPDSVIVLISGGNIGGSELLIDNLQFAGGNVGIKYITLTDPTISIYPNPTAGDATLKIALPKSNSVSFVILNSLGQEITSENLGVLKDGVQTIKLNTEDYSKGIYFVKVKVGDNLLTQKVIVK